MYKKIRMITYGSKKRLIAGWWIMKTRIASFMRYSLRIVHTPPEVVVVLARLDFVRAPTDKGREHLRVTSVTEGFLLEGQAFFLSSNHFFAE